MPFSFQLPERLIGIAMSSANAGENVAVLTQELLGPHHPSLVGRLEELQGVLFSRFPQFPSPSTIDHALLLIRPDLSGIGFINELSFKATVRASRDIEVGAKVILQDISEVMSLDLGIEVPADNGIVLVRSRGWRRSLFFDFGPLDPRNGPRRFALGQMLAQQEMLLLGLEFKSSAEPSTTPLQSN